MLSNLPAELRSRIYSYVLSTEDGGFIVLRALPRGDLAGDMGLPSYSRPLQNPEYHEYRHKNRDRDKWPDPVEEAFHKALQWTGMYQNKLNGTYAAHSDEMIAETIYEYTGQAYNRKQVSSHLQHLRRMSGRMSEICDPLTQQIVQATTKLKEATPENTAEMNRELGRIQQATYLLARRNQGKEFAAFALTRRKPKQSRGKTLAQPKLQIRPGKILLDSPTHSLFHQICQLAPHNDCELSLRLLRRLGSFFLALSLVDRFFRTEVLQYIESNLCFDFTWNAVTLGLFCTNIKPTHRQQVQHMAIEFVYSETPRVLSPLTNLGTYLSKNLPNLRRIHLTLYPRDRNRRGSNGFYWTQQPKNFSPT